jgi:lipopolysaccharide/colanic/teichoic acid biosynthesis glycosyltransferase
MLNSVNDRSFVQLRQPVIAAGLPLSRAALPIGLGVALLEAGAVTTVILYGLGREGLTVGPIEAGLAVLFGLAMSQLVQAMQGYRFARLWQPERALPQLLGLAALVVAAGMAISAALVAELALDAWSVLGAITLAAMAQAMVRLVVAVLVQQAEQRGSLLRRIAVLDFSPLDRPLDAGRLEADLAAERDCACRLEVVRALPDTPEAAAAAVEVVRWAEEIVVVVAPDRAAPAQLGHLLEALEIVPVTVDLAVPVTPARGGSAMRRVQEAPLGPAARTTKRLADIVLTRLMLLFLGPLLLIVALAVKLDSPGPVFFRQIRRGYNNRSFDAPKFRTLRHDMADPLANRLVTRSDLRVTRVGAFLRRSAIDELPQLLNVLNGDMALVGPRPHPLNTKAGGPPYEEVVERFQRRYRVRPGITGWAQVNGLRGNTETKDDLLRRVDYELDYIRRWSLWLDFLILLRTPLATFKGENAC